MTAEMSEHLDPSVRRGTSGFDEHADRHEEEHGERFAERQQVGADLMAERRLADDDAGDERAERERDAEEAPADASAVPTATVSATSTNSSRDRVLHDAAEQRAAPARADDQHQRDEDERLADGPQRGRAQASPLADGAPAAGSSTRIATVARSSNTSQPTATLPCRRVEPAVVHQARSSTTVLATEIARPRTSAPPVESPSRAATQ